MYAVIPYETFPKIALGPLELRTFGVMVGLGVLIGAWLAARYIEQHTGVSRDDTYRLRRASSSPV
jgi:prolipoprotein diacylglyceryltransferase